MSRCLDGAVTVLNVSVFLCLSYISLFQRICDERLCIFTTDNQQDATILIYSIITPTTTHI